MASMGVNVSSDIFLNMSNTLVSLSFNNVICSGSTISYQSNLPADETYEIEDYVAFYQQEICPALQNGNLTLEDMWFGE